ncbi:MAG TPA: glycosyltransferase family 9 protein, partial [Armatimonadota bacterium]|nr:glycosyltransferase family 9 protein [Armatimonadota bacterium]
MKEAQPTRIIVLRSGAVGDCILSTPALSALRRAYPSAHLTLLGDPFSADLFKGSPDIDRLIKLDPKVMRRREYLTALLRLRRERFSLLVDLHGNSRTFLQTLLIGGKRRLGFETRHSRSIVYTHRAPYR